MKHLRSKAERREARQVLQSGGRHSVCETSRAVVDLDAIHLHHQQIDEVTVELLSFATINLVPPQYRSFERRRRNTQPSPQQQRPKHGPQPGRDSPRARGLSHCSGLGLSNNRTDTQAAGPSCRTRRKTWTRQP